MTPSGLNRPRIGIPWRTSQEEADENRPKIKNYEEAVRVAGGEAVLLKLNDPKWLELVLPSLDGFVLPGSPKDVDPKKYGASDLGKCAGADPPREQTDWAILAHAFGKKKPVLAICYGCQLLNVYLGGSLVQDLQSQTGTQTPHRKKDLRPEPKDDPQHAVRFESGSQLAELAGCTVTVVNSSHHQSVEKPGRQLRITGHSPDGIVESVEWTGDANWVVGVQWHPERMGGDPLAERLFSELVMAARAGREVSATRS